MQKINIEDERALTECVIRDIEQGTYYIAQYLIKKLNITDTTNFDRVQVKIETQRILKQFVSDKIKLKVINKIIHMPRD